MDAMNTFNTALLVMVAVIFGLTALLALASIPDWIKIPEWYKKKLFTVLIIEVVTLVTAHLGIYLKVKNDEVNKIQVEQVFDKERILTAVADTTMKYVYAVANNKDTLGRFSTNGLLNGLSIDWFNAIEYDAENSELDGYARIIWNEVNGEWKQSTDSIKGCPYYMRVRNLKEPPYGTAYEIIDKRDTDKPALFSSAGSSKDYFNTASRMMHAIEYTDTNRGDRCYAIFRIMAANLRADTTGRRNKNVEVLQMKIKPIWDDKKTIGN